MSKPKTPEYRIYQLSEEFNRDSQFLIDFLKKHKIKVKNRFSAIDEQAYELLKNSFPRRKPKPAEQKPEEVKAEEKSETSEKKQPEGKSDKNQQEQGQKQTSGENGNKKSGDRKPGENRDKKTGDRKPGENRGKKSGETSDKKSEEQKPVEQVKPESGGESENQNSEDGGKRRRRRNRHRKSEESGENEGGENSQVEEEKREKPTDTRGERGDRNNRRNRDRDKEDGGGRAQQNRDRNRRQSQNSKQDSGLNPNDRRQDRRPPRKKKNRQQPAPVHKVEIARPTHIKVGESIAVKDLASKMSCTAAEVIKKLLMMGVIAGINQEIDFDTAALVAEEFGVTAEELPPEVDPTLIPEIEDAPETLKFRPPVVTVMGHVDHGKTSLLDVIRKSSVTATEAGGITQHIGAYHVMCKDKKIVFLDTPGHEAFTAMRARGAQVTDIAILVVAADDGVMPQTIEAINHSKAAGVPIIVAINKIDKPGANPERVKQELIEHELIPEEYGGDTIMVPVSAKKKIGINDLLEMILLVAEVRELKANPNREARGVIIEAQLDKGRGPVATVLVQSGTLRIGDSIVAGTTFGKVRAMINDRGDNVKKAGPSVPVEVLGLNDVPAAGDLLAALDEKLAKSIAEHRIERQRTELIKSKKVSLDDLYKQIQAGAIKDLNIVVKADVQGSVEALSSSLLTLNKNDEVRVSIVHSGVGAVNESDIMLASAANALIIAFNVRPDANARKVADAENIDIRTYRVIYDAIDDVKAAMSGMLAPKYKEVIQGRVEIRKVMKFSKALVAGSYVLEGKIHNNSKIRILRDHVEIFDGEIDSLRRFKDEVKEVAAGYECGISIVDYRDFKEGDIIEAYTMQEIEVSLSDVNKDSEG